MLILKPYHPWMTLNETDILAKFLNNCDRYMEFGTGGSTLFAANIVKSSVTTVDSSPGWIDSIAEQAKKCQISPTFIYANIGPVKNLGYPVDLTSKNQWTKYSTAPWNLASVNETDLYLIDGRFRVACFVQCITHCRLDSVIAIHDFAARPQYHIVREISREIASVDNLSFFVPLQTNSDVLELIYDRYKFDPN